MAPATWEAFEVRSLKLAWATEQENAWEEEEEKNQGRKEELTELTSRTASLEVRKR